TAIKVEGQLDFIGVIAVPDSPETRDASYYRFFLRDSVLSTPDGFRLEDLAGELKLANGEMHGDRMTAVLARTPVVLRDTSFRSDKDGFRLETSFDATAVPIDRDHLSAFVDPNTLEGLIEELRWRGTLDVRGGRLVLSGPTQGSGKLELSGKITPHDMFVQMG